MLMASRTYDFSPFRTRLNTIGSNIFWLFQPKLLFCHSFPKIQDNMEGGRHGRGQEKGRSAIREDASASCLVIHSPRRHWLWEQEYPMVGWLPKALPPGHPGLDTHRGFLNCGEEKCEHDEVQGKLRQAKVTGYPRVVLLFCCFKPSPELFTPVSIQCTYTWDEKW
jgi:hypothetical protein